MSRYAWKRYAQGSFLYVFWGCDRIADETLTADTVNDHVFWTDYSPVSTKGLILRGYVGADWEFVVNFDLEPLSGRITVDASLPAYDSIHAWYGYYENQELDIVTKDYRVTFPQLMAEVDMWGQPHYSVHNNYPTKVSFKWVLFNEESRNLLTESMFSSCYFILIDKGTSATYGIRAFEGPIWSDEQGSLFKGASYLLPIEVMVQQFGLYTEEIIDADILSVTNAGSGYVNLWVVDNPAKYGLLEIGDWIEVTDTTNYNGVWQVHDLVTSGVNRAIQVKITYVSDQTGIWERHAEIHWGFWEN